MKKLIYKNVKITLSNNAVASKNALQKFLFNCWNYTKNAESQPEAFFTDNDEKEFQSFSFIQHDTNFGGLTNRSIMKNNNNEKVQVYDYLVKVANVNNHDLIVIC